MTVLSPLHGFLWILGVVILLVDLWALIDAAIRPASAYQVADKRTKAFWIAILALAFAFAFLFAGLGFLGLIGLVAAIVYLVDVRPALREVSGGRGSGGGPYGGW